MSGVATAIGGSAILGYLGSQSAASTQANAATQAASMQQQATMATIAAQKEALAQQRADLQPFTQLGTSAVPTLAKLLGQDGSMTPEDTMKLDPGYQFRMSQGQAALEANQAASRGPGLSGATLKELTQYGQDYASNEFTNVFNRQMSAAGLGQASAAGQASATGASANAVGNATMGGANAAGNYLTQGANASASGTVGGINAITGAVNNYMGQQTLRQILGSGNTTGTQAPAPVQYGPSDPYSVAQSTMTQ